MKMNVGKKAKIVFPILFLCIVALLAVCFWRNSQKQTAPQLNVSESTVQSADTAGSGSSEPAEKPDIPIDFQALQRENPDVYAWIRIPDTTIDYPILQSSTDNDYYLFHTLEGKSGYPGSIYTENYNKKDFSDFNTVIYGHKMRNHTMFADLEYYEDLDYLKQHNMITIYTPDHIRTYQVFAAVTYDNRHIMYSFDFVNQEQRQAYLDSLKAVRNMATCWDESVSVTTEDKIITLSTCNGNENQRFLVEAVLIDEK